MFADPQSVTVNGTAVSLPRISSTGNLGVFRSADGLINLDIRQAQTANRFRREFRLTQKKIAADPISAVNKEVSASVIIAIDTPKFGFSNTELGYLHAALDAAFTNAQRDKLLGGEI